MDDKSFFELIDMMVKLQDCMTKSWHTGNFIIPAKYYDNKLIKNLLLNHMMNFKLWHVEDVARRRDVDATVIAKCKYDIDLLNQKRTYYFEITNDIFCKLLSPLVSQYNTKVQNTESIGSVIDRLSIASLKIYHMAEEYNRRSAADRDYKSVGYKLKILKKQKQNLIDAFKYSIYEYFCGIKRPMQYKQFKMYNEKELNPELYKKIKNDILK